MLRLKRSIQYGAPTAAVALMMTVTVTEVWATDAKPQAENKKTNAEVAVDAYDKADATPVENWFGCPPVVEGNPSPAEQAAVKEHCEPTTETQPNSTQ